jgi:hypothetical protein
VSVLAPLRQQWPSFRHTAPALFRPAHPRSDTMSFLSSSVWLRRVSIRNGARDTPSPRPTTTTTHWSLFYPGDYFTPAHRPHKHTKRSGLGPRVILYLTGPQTLELVWKAGVSRSFFQIGKRGSANRDFGYANRDPEPRFRNREIQTHIQFM